MVKSEKVVSHEKAALNEFLSDKRAELEKKNLPVAEVAKGVSMVERLANSFFAELHSKYDAEAKRQLRTEPKVDSTAVADFESQSIAKVLQSEAAGLKALGMNQKDVSSALKLREEMLHSLADKLHKLYAEDYRKELRTEMSMYG